MDPPGLPVGGPEATVPGQLAAMGKDEAPRSVHERLGVGDALPGEARRAAEMDERGGGLGAAERLAGGVVAEGAGGPVGGQLPSGADPGSAPPEAGDPVVLEPLGEVPQVGEGEGASERTASNSHVDEMVAAGRATAGGPWAADGPWTGAQGIEAGATARPSRPAAISRAPAPRAVSR